MYDYTVYKNVSGQSFIDNLVTRTTYCVLDPGKNANSTFYYSHQTSTPVLYGSSTVSYISGRGIYALQLRTIGNNGTSGMVNAFMATPSEVRLAKDLIVPNDIYLGTSRDWRLHVDINGGRFLFQKLNTTSGQYDNMSEIVRQ